MIQPASRRTLLVGVLLLLIPHPGLSAQQADTAAARQAAEQRLGRPVSNAEILQRVRASGLTRAQARDRLRQLGYDPSLADPYYDALESGGAAPAGASTEQFARALDDIERAPQVDLVQDTVEPPVRDTVRAPEEEEGLPLFGQDLFDRVTTEFQPILYGPVDEGYRLGPGDEILLVLTGGVESAYSLEVNRQGSIIVPDVGQVPVHGKTMAELEQTLYQYLGRVYSGLRGPEPTIQFQASLGRLRTNQVYIMGEVERPGAYQVSAVATVFNALYRAGGPNRSGSFRRIEVWRGDRVVRTIDLYDYLLSGDSRDDVRLDNGDRIHVPLTGTRASVEGAVRRPAIYELRPTEQLVDLLGFAGGFRADAVVRRVQIDRILPPLERTPGADRVLVDVDVAALLMDEGEAVDVVDGDVVTVFAVSGERRNRVRILGDVRRPGTYEWVPGTTLGDLLARAEGLEEAAYTGRAHIFRLNEAVGDRRLIPVSLEPDAGGAAAADVPLADRDSVVIYSRAELRTPQYVYISGHVKEPGRYHLAEGMTVQDLVLAAGGFTDGAHALSAEVARPPADGVRTDTTAHVLRVPLGVGDGEWAPISEGGARADVAEFELRRDDRVFIRRAPGHAEPRAVVVTGEVEFPGRYILATRRERLTDVLQRAGGFTSQAYVPGIRIVRDGKLVAVNAERALERPDGPLNVALEEGDSLEVPAFDPTVLVQGAVNFESRVVYRAGRGLDYYIDRAGGYQEAADRERISVVRPNGERTTSRPFLMMRRDPSVTPGSTIFVPAVPESERGRLDFDALLSRTLSIASVTATLLLAISQLN